MIQSAPPASTGPGSTGPDAPSDEEGDNVARRPPWHWVGFGTVAIFAAWLPLAYGAQAIVARVLARHFGASPSAEEVRANIASMPASERARLMAILALPNVLALAIASFGGGYLVGRFGTGTGTREAASAGGMTALVALVLSLGAGAGGSGMAAVVTAAVTAILCVGFAAWGGRVGVAQRARAARPHP